MHCFSAVTADISRETAVSVALCTSAEHSLLVNQRIPDSCWLSGDSVRCCSARQGQAAEWAREHLETGHFESQGRLKRVDVTKEDAESALAKCSKIVSATGFDRNPLPEISVDGERLGDVSHDPSSGAIIPGKLYGYGIAFPEEITDPEYGHKESNVGLWKFMRYVRDVLPAQNLCTLQQAG